MRYLILTALTWYVVAGLALADSTSKKAAAPPRKAVPAAAPKTAAKTPLAKVPARTPAKTPVRTTVNRPLTGHPATTAARTAVTSRNRYTAYHRQQPVHRYSAQQVTPTADRYREIQDALAARGYLKTPFTGVWDKDSADAMQRFQQDQKLEPTGKLTARSLGALGLGPKPGESTLLAPNPTPSLSANPGSESTPLQ